MSRSGYSDDVDDNWQLIKYRGWVASACRGKRGQAFFVALAEALEAMPVKVLIADELQDQKTGAVCAIGALGAARGMDMTVLDPDDPDGIAAAFDIASPLAREVVFENDEGNYSKETPAARWLRMRAWVDSQIKTLKAKEPRP